MKLSCILILLLVAVASSRYYRRTRRAVVVINGPKITGRLHIFQYTTHYGTHIRIQGKLRGLTKGNHGFHVHEFGKLENNCAAAGAHYNPRGKNHGAPEDRVRHIGDLGNIYANKYGIARVNIRDRVVRLNGRFSVIGRAIVVHAATDDLGQGGNAESLKTGNAGGRVGCGIIRRYRRYYRY